MFFNLAFDQLLRKFLSLRGSYDLPLSEETQHLLAYADDVLLVCPPERVGQDLGIFSRLSSSVGLEMNLKKTVLLVFRKGEQVRDSVLSEAEMRESGGCRPSLMATYLGVDLGWQEAIEGNFWLRFEGMLHDLDLLRLSPLGLFQKMDAVLTFWMPRFVHVLRLGSLRFRTLEDAEVRARNRFLLMLRISITTNFKFLYGSRRRHCLGLPHLVLESACQLLGRVGKMLQEERFQPFMLVAGRMAMADPVCRRHISVSVRRRVVEAGVSVALYFPPLPFALYFCR
jgi:hypothetical protein